MPKGIPSINDTLGLPRNGDHLFLGFRASATRAEQDHLRTTPHPIRSSELLPPPQAALISVEAVPSILSHSEVPRCPSNEPKRSLL
jgi:hypothetical protein